MFSFEGTTAPCRITQSYILCKHNISPVLLLVASAPKRYAGLVAGRGTNSARREPKGMRKIILHYAFSILHFYNLHL